MRALPLSVFHHTVMWKATLKVTTILPLAMRILTLISPIEFSRPGYRRKEPMTTRNTGAQSSVPKMQGPTFSTPRLHHLYQGASLLTSLHRTVLAWFNWIDNILRWIIGAGGRITSVFPELCMMAILRLSQSLSTIQSSIVVSTNSKTLHPLVSGDSPRTKLALPDGGRINGT